MKFHSKEFKDVGTRSSTSVILLTALTSDATSYSAVAVQIGIVTVATKKPHDIHWLRTFAYIFNTCSTLVRIVVAYWLVPVWACLTEMKSGLEQKQQSDEQPTVAD